MHAASALVFLAMPFTLSSLPSLVVFKAHPVVVARRISAEEAFLEKKLDGYAEYKTRVRYKAIPFLWRRRTGFPFFMAYDFAAGAVSRASFCAAAGA